MESIGKILIVAGIVLIVTGIAFFFAGKFGLPLARLPGDLRIEKDGSGFYFPVATSILVSLLLTLVLNIVIRVLKK